MEGGRGMSECGYLERIEERLASGDGLRPTEIEHVRHCVACSEMVASAARMEAGLAGAARALIVESLPPVGELLLPGERLGQGRFGVSRTVTGMAATAIVVVLAVVTGLVGLNLWQGAVGGPSPSPSPSPRVTPTPTPRSLPADMAGWVEAAGASIWTHMDRTGSGPAMVLVRLERCGDSALAFFEDPSPAPGAPLLFGAGNYRDEPYDAGFGGAASSVDDPEAAYARSQQPPCTVVVDTTVSADAALAAYLRSDPHATDPQIIATRLVTADIVVAYVDELRDGEHHQQVLVLQRDLDRWTVTGAQGGQYPASPGSSVGVTPLGVAKGMPDNRWVAVGVVPSNEPRIVAVEFTFEGFVHRYPVAGTGFVILLPENVGVSLPYTFVDANGVKLQSETTQP
ncbi:MAG: hypothetical protein ACXWYG_09990 [Aeromicrobium sp.]